MERWRHVALGTSLLVAFAAPVRANDAPVRAALSWSSPPQCVPSAELAEAVEAILARSVWAAEAEAEVSLEGVLALEADGLRLELTLRAAGHVVGTRLVRRPGADCESFVRTAAVVVALLVDLPRRDVALLLPREADPRLPPAPVDRPLAPSRLSRSGDPIVLRIDSAFVLDAGTLPAVAVGGELGVEAEPPGFPAFRLGGRLLAPSESDTDASGRAASVWSAGALFELCPTWRASPLRLGLCAGGALDALVGAGLGLSNARGAVAFRLSIHALAVAVLELGRIGFALRLGSSLTLAADRFVRDAGTPSEAVLHEPAVASFISTLGLVVRLAP